MICNVVFCYGKIEYWRYKIWFNLPGDPRRLSADPNSLMSAPAQKHFPDPVMTKACTFLSCAALSRWDKMPLRTFKLQNKICKENENIWGHKMGR